MRYLLDENIPFSSYRELQKNMMLKESKRYEEASDRESSLLNLFFDVSTVSLTLSKYNIQRIRHESSDSKGENIPGVGG